MARPRILIVGAGISGLSLAHALADRGRIADVVERGTEPRTTGTGLYLPANAVRALRAIGLGAALAGRARPITRQRLLDHRGRVLAAFDVSTIWGDVGGCYATSRNALQEILVAAVGAGAIGYGRGVAAVDEQGTVTFADGTREDYDLVVGADGIASTVRATAFAGSPPRFLNQICWRYLATDTTGSVPEGTWTVRLGAKGRSFLTLPLGDGRVYVYADINSDRPDPPEGDWRTLFAEYADPVPALLEQGADAYFAALEEIDDDDWVRPHAVLVGDAAHACSPSMAQGGAMALEDSLVLAELLAEVTDRAAIPAALAAYRSRRADRVRWVLAQNHRRDKARDLPGGVRNLFLRVGGERLFRANHTGLLPQP